MPTPLLNGEPVEMPSENIPIVLPSDLPASLRQGGGCASDLEAIELRLRDAQCQTALDDLRNGLLMKSRLQTYKGSHVRHQGATTRSRSLLDRNEAKIQLHAAKYQAAWSAKFKLVGENSVGWKRLDKKHIRCMEDKEDPAIRNVRKVRGKNPRNPGDSVVGSAGDGEGEGEGGAEEVVGDDDAPDASGGEPHRRQNAPHKGVSGEGTRVVSWIWMGADAAGFTTDSVLHTGLRVEWSKTWARVRRWREEVDLLKEEMRRVLVSLEYKAAWWDARRSIVGYVDGEGMGPTDAHLEGASAYAHSQAALLRRLRDRFAAMWDGNRFGDEERDEEVLDDVDNIDDVPLAEVEGEQEEEVQGEEEGGLFG